MSWYSGGELVTGGWTSSSYAGHGILFENLPTTGENGGSPLLNDGGVNGDEVRWQLLTVTGLTVDEFNEDGSFVSTGTGSFDYRSYVNGAAVGDFTATAQAAGDSSSAALSWPLFSVAASQSQDLPSGTSTANVSWPLFSVASSQSSALPAGSITVNASWPMLTVSASESSTVPVITADAAVTWPMFTVTTVSGVFEYYSAESARLSLPSLSRRIDL